MVALIVLNYNDYETTEKYIKTVREYDVLDKIVVVDNCSTDNSFEKLLQFASSKIDVIKTDSNKGYASGNNYGFYHIVKNYKMDYVIISNPDVEFAAEIVDVMINQMKQSSNIGMISCKMNCTSGINTPIAWKIPRYWDCVLENLIILKKIIGNRLEYKESHFNNQLCVVDVIPGSFFMMPVDVFKEVEGFDESTFLYYEENMLAYKLLERGYKEYIIGDKEYIHRHSISINKNINSVKRRLQIAYESRCIYCKKYLKVGKAKQFILKVTFKIGLFNYLFALKILNKQR